MFISFTNVSYTAQLWEETKLPRKSFQMKSMMSEADSRHFKLHYAAQRHSYHQDLSLSVSHCLPPVLEPFVWCSDTALGSYLTLFVFLTPLCPLCSAPKGNISLSVEGKWKRTVADRGTTRRTVCQWRQWGIWKCLFHFLPTYITTQFSQ